MHVFGERKSLKTLAGPNPQNTDHACKWQISTVSTKGFYSNDARLQKPQIWQQSHAAQIARGASLPV